tara:strand:+ start:2189 stop:3208 length:1020 start_codon:yes stop_codon:yes gene_type:complete
MSENLFLNLIEDEKKTNQNLYSSGPYWKHKNRRTIYQIKKNKINNFRGINSGIGTSFSDNIVYDIRNEFNFKGRLASSLLLLPFLKSIFKSQLKITKSYIDRFLINQSFVFSNSKRVEQLINKYNFLQTTEFGCVQKFNFNKIEYSTHYLEMANRVDSFSEFINFKNIVNYFEIGGGFGANIHFLLQNFRNIKKIVYLDTVPNIYIGTEYLRKFFRENVIDYLQTKKMDQIKFSNDNSLEIICIPPWEIERVECEIDHFHNAASFVEMPAHVVENYIKFVDKFNTTSISLLSYSKFDPQTTMDPNNLINFFKKELKSFKYPFVIPGLKPNNHYFVSKIK